MGQRDITREIRKLFEGNDNENKMYHNLWTVADMVHV